MLCAEYVITISSVATIYINSCLGTLASFSVDEILSAIISQCIVLEFPDICMIPSKILTEYFRNPNNNVEWMLWTWTRLIHFLNIQWYLLVECPEDDIVLPDYELCHNKGPGYCYKGVCRTHNSGCQLLWGDKAVSGANVWYELNHQGSQGNDMCSIILWVGGMSTENIIITRLK